MLSRFLQVLNSRSRLFDCLLLIVGMLSTLAGCSVGPDNEPSVEDLVGTYVLTSESRAFLAQRKLYGSIPESTIVLNKDLTLSIKNIPDCFGSSLRESKGQFLSAAGTWRVVIPEAAATYGLDIDISEGGTLAAATYASQVIFKEKSAPFKLHLPIGDNDSGDELVFERTQ